MPIIGLLEVGLSLPVSFALSIVVWRTIVVQFLLF
jgi:hypothetical protein